MAASKLPTVAFHTLGCRLNQYETEAIREQFEARGYQVVPFGERADVYIINTCTVTSQADYSSRQSLRRAIRHAPDATVVATGCYAQTNPQALLQVEGVDLVLGNAEKGRLVEYILDAVPVSRPVAHVTRRAAITQFDERLDVKEFEGRTRASIKVQDGCDQFCTFCIIPWARGRHRSRSLDSILQQTGRLVAAGYKEIVLTGVHLGEYGTDLAPPVSLTDAVRALLQLSGLPRLRLSSIWPTAVPEMMIRLMAETSPRFCRYVHLALQSGDDEVLRRMRRTYTADDTRRLIERLTAAIPDIGIGADVMVGFPGESDRQFMNTYELLDALPITYLHVFSYSKRTGTRAASFPDQVPAAVAQERSEQLRRLSAAKSFAFHRRFIGRHVDVLVEGRRDPKTGRLIGLTDHFVRVLLPGDDRLMNTIIPVHIEQADADELRGILISPKSG